MSQQSSLCPEPKPAAEDIDVYCLTCGYNLRGLSGDPRRCPECGHLNPMGGLELPAQLIAAQLRRMETGPTVCVGAFLLCLVLSLQWFTVLYKDFGYIDLEAVMRTGLPLLASMALWLWEMSNFRSACLGRDGWWPLLCKYHLCALFLSGLIVLIIYVGPCVFFMIDEYFFLDQSRYDFSYKFFLLMIIPLIILVIFILGRRVHRRIKADMDTLQREVAVKIARERLKKVLHDARRNK